VDRDRRALLLRVAVALLLAGVYAAIWLSGAAPSADEARDWGEDLGWIAAVVWPPLFGLIVFFLPWPIVAGATGFVFGTAAGTPLSIAGVLFASSFQFWLSRHVPTHGLRRSVMGRVPRLDGMLERNGFLAVFYTRLLPLLPWGVVSYAAGFARVRLRDVLLATVAAGTPKIFAYTALGGSFDDLTRPEALVAFGMLAVLTLIGIAVGIRRFSRAEPAA
jgi:uncharacterized membrane protein YdjX (TVP38/TMEM64 family)